MSVLKILAKINEVGEAAHKMQWGEKSKTLNDVAEDKDKQDLLFEFLCYISLVHQFDQDGYTVALENPGGALTARWPMKAANPDNFSFFSLGVGRSTYRICPGVKIRYKDLSSHCAPDISIRREIGDTDYMYMCWDAKYRSNPEYAITRSEVYTFSLERQMIPTRISKALAAAVAGFGAGSCFAKDGILSNGCHSSEHPDMLRKLKCGETSHFGSHHQITRP